MNQFSEEQIKKINEILKAKKINVNINDENDLNKTLTELGIDSLSALSLIVEIEEKFNIRLNDDKIGKVKNLRDLLNLIQESIKN